MNITFPKPGVYKVNIIDNWHCPFCGGKYHKKLDKKRRIIPSHQYHEHCAQDALMKG